MLMILEFYFKQQNSTYFFWNNQLNPLSYAQKHFLFHLTALNFDFYFTVLSIQMILLKNSCHYISSLSLKAVYIKRDMIYDRSFKSSWKHIIAFNNRQLLTNYTNLHLSLCLIKKVRLQQQRQFVSMRYEKKNSRS